MAGMSFNDLKNQLTQGFSGGDIKFRDASNYEFKSGTASGSEMEKAKLIVEKKGSELSENSKSAEISFQYNPNEITVSKKVKFDKAANGAQNTKTKQFAGGVSREITFPNLVFDTFEKKKSVYTEYIQKIEEALHFNKDMHRPPKVMLIWGEFLKSDGSSSGQIQQSFPCYVTEMTVKYTMFLENGSPVRADVSLKLEEVGNYDEKKSPDHAKLYTVRRGDTLQHIAYREYDNPGEWRRIARTNGIDNPMQLRPGTKLLIPPILK